MKTIDQLPEAEIVRIAAVEVMGLEVHEEWTKITKESSEDYKGVGVYAERGYTQSFSPLTDANDDVMVLDFINANWSHDDRTSFAVKLQTMHHGNLNRYRIGDYTRAAVAVVLARKEKEDD